MDISFHYFAVKTVAYAAGFDDADAQTIAQYSQYIDDYNPTWPRRYSNVPDWIKNKPGSDIYISSHTNPMNFKPVTTGFMIPTDIMNMLTSNFQKNVISPFHFVPFNRNKLAAGDQTTYPVKITDGGDGSFISNFLLSAKMEYQNAPNDDNRRQALMHIGMLLHTFADTYAHQKFSGYNQICNNMKIVKVIDNNTNIDITFKSNSYVDIILKLYEDAKGQFSDKMFQIGHMLVGHLPDWTHITFEIAFYDREGHIERTYKRNNTECFTDVALEILDFLCECNNQPKIGGDLRQTLSTQLIRAFKISDISTIEGDEKKCMTALTNAWTSVFENNHYIYDRSNLFDGIVKAAKNVNSPDKDETTTLDLFPKMSEDFYKFNSYAEDLLIAIYGNNPRKNN